MKLYATVASERASKGQGGNEYLEIGLLVGSKAEQNWAGTITLREIAPDKFQVFYTAPVAGKGDKSGILCEVNTKGEKQKDERVPCKTGLHDKGKGQSCVC